MVQMKTKMWAIVVASSLLVSTAMIGAADRESTTSAPAVSHEQFLASIRQAVATMATRPAARSSIQSAQASQDQDPPLGRRPRTSQSCSCGIPSWIKYSLIGVAAAGGGYALAQAVRHGDGGGRGVDGPEGVGR